MPITEDIRVTLKAKDEISKTLKEVKESLARVAAQAQATGSVFESQEAKSKRAAKALVELKEGGEALKDLSRQFRKVKEDSAKLGTLDDDVDKVTRSLKELKKAIKDYSNPVDPKLIEDQKKLNKELDEAVLANADAEKAVQEYAAGLDRLKRPTEKAIRNKQRIVEKLKVEKQKILEGAQALGVLIDREKQLAAQRKTKALDKLTNNADLIDEEKRAIESLNRAIKQKERDGRKTGTDVRSLEAKNRELKRLEVQQKKLNLKYEEAVKLEQETTAANGANVKSVQRKITAQEKLEEALIQTKKANREANAELRKTQVPPEAVAEMRRLEAAAKATNAAIDDTARRAIAANKAVGAQSGAKPKELTDQLAREEKALKRLNAQRARQRQELAQLTARLRDAGLETDDLEQAERELLRTAERTEAAMRDQASATRDVGAAANRATSGIQGFRAGTRQSLGAVQRLRGQLLALTAAYVGVYGAADQVREVFKTAGVIEAAEARISVFFDGDNGRAAKEMAYLNELADDLKLNVLDLTDAYSRFIAGADSAEFSVAEIRTMFEALATANRAGKFGAEAFKRSMTAVTQVLSKGVLASEELKGQLAEALPGAVQGYAASLQISTEELFARMEDSAIGARTMINFAQYLKDEWAPALDVALDSADASLQEFQTAIARTRLAVADSGFLDVLVDALQRFTQAMDSNEVREGFVELAGIIGKMILLLPKLLENFDKLILAVKVLGGYLIAGTIAGAFVKIASALKILWGILRAIAGSSVILALGRALAGLAVAGTGPIGLAIAAIGVLTTALWGLWAAFRGDEDAKNLEKNTEKAEKAGKKIEISLRKRIQMAEAEVHALAKQELYLRKIAALTDDEERKAEFLLAAEEDKARLAAKTANLRSLRIAQQNEIGKVTPEDIDAARPLSAQERKKFEQDTARFSRKIEEKSAQTLKEKLKVVIDSYEQVLKRLDEVDVKDNEKKAKRVEGDKEIVNAAKAAEIQRVTQEHELAFLREKEKLEKRLDALQKKQREEQIKSFDLTEPDQFQQATELKTTAIKEFLAPQRQQFKDYGIQDGVDYIDGLEQALIENAGEDFLAKKVRQEQKKLADAMKPVNDMLAVRASREEQIRAQRENGDIKLAEAERRIIANQEELNPLLIKNAQAALKVAEHLGDEKAVARLQALIEQLKKIDAETKKYLPTAEDVNDMLTVGLVDGFEEFVQGTKSAGEAFDDFAKDFLKNLAKMIAQQRIFDLLANFGGGEGGLGGLISRGVGQKHTGGLVEAPGVTRNVPSYIFNGAPLYHSGGVVGLKNNEVPIIAQRGEEVLTKNDPRHRSNQGGGTVGAGPSSMQVSLSGDALNMTMRDFLERELARTMATQ